jgi:predicted aldo/keto reductase-like oxidoreductase
MSTVGIYGGAALSNAEQMEADTAVNLAIEYGVNHIDVAPQYGLAEELLGPWLARERERFFLGCKTMERTKQTAEAELHRSLERLQVDHFDLYQLHAITSIEELDKVLGRNGALEAIQQAKEDGLTNSIGITGHGYDAPEVFLEALRRFDFDTVMFPLNFVQYQDRKFRENAEELLRQCRFKDVGVMIIKSITRGPWGEQPKTHNTWYQPFTAYEHIQQSVNFVLSQDVNGICVAGDTRLLPLVLEACEKYKPMSKEEQSGLIDSAVVYDPLFVSE